MYDDTGHASLVNPKEVQDVLLKCFIHEVRIVLLYTRVLSEWPLHDVSLVVCHFHYSFLYCIGTGCWLELIVSSLNTHMWFASEPNLTTCRLQIAYIACANVSPPLLLCYTMLLTSANPHTHTPTYSASGSTTNQKGRWCWTSWGNHTRPLVCWNLDGYHWSPHHLQPVHQWQVPLQPWACYGDVGPMWTQRTASWAGQGVNRLNLLFHTFTEQHWCRCA